MTILLSQPYLWVRYAKFGCTVQFRIAKYLLKNIVPAIKNSKLQFVNDAAVALSWLKMNFLKIPN